MMINILIADDHPVVRDGISQMLTADPSLKVVGAASNSTELMQLLESVSCDVIVTDYSMSGGHFGDGLLMLHTLRRRYPKIPIIVMTMLDNPALIRDMQKAGVQGILNKLDPTSLLITAVHAVTDGLSYLSPLLQATLAERGIVAEKAQEPRLSKRELEVLRQCAAGIPLTEIARLSNRSSKTISVQKSVAMKKLGLSNDYELYQYAITHGLISESQ